MASATTIDRIVAIVGKRAIKQSDIERDLRVTQFLNNAPPNTVVKAQKESLERLIDQELIRADMAAAGNTSYLEADARALFNQLLRERFGNSRPKLDTELKKRGLKDSEVLQQLQWQLVVLRFIDQRFRPGVIIDDEAVRRYYQTNRQQLRAGKGDSSLEALTPTIRETLEAEGVNRNFEEWLAEARKTAVIQYKVEALK